MSLGEIYCCCVSNGYEKTGSQARFVTVIIINIQTKKTIPMIKIPYYCTFISSISKESQLFRARYTVAKALMKS